MTSKAQTKKANIEKCDYFKPKKLLQAEEIIDRVKRQRMEKEKIFANHTLIRG